MPKRKNHRYEKIKQKLRKIERMMQQTSSSSSDSEYQSEEEHERGRNRINSRRIDSSSESEIEVENQTEENSIVQERDLSALLGEDPARNNTTGPPLDPEIVTRWSNYLTMGLDADTRNRLSQIKIPENCSLLKGPILNSEMENILSPLDRKKDGILIGIQDKLGKGLSLMGATLNNVLKDDFPLEIKNAILPNMVDACRLFCETHYLLSIHRKHQVLPSLNPTSQKVAATEQSKIGKLLFGEDFGGRCKVAQTVQRTSGDIKKKAFMNSYQKTTGNLNSRRHQPTSRMKYPATSSKNKNNPRDPVRVRREDQKMQYRPRWAQDRKMK